MTRKRIFIDKKSANRFRLLPSSDRARDSEQDQSPAPTKTEHFVPSAGQLEEQHSYGIFFDDDYDYLKHLKSRDDKAELFRMDESSSFANGAMNEDDFKLPETFLFGDLSEFVIKSNKKKTEKIDPEIEKILAGTEASTDLLEDNFIELAGGPIETAFTLPREVHYSDEEFDYEEKDFDDLLDESEEEDSDKTVQRDQLLQRDIDEGFDNFLESAYCPEKIGGLEPDDPRMKGVLDPNNPRIIQLIGRQKGLPEYDPEFAKEDVRKRLRFWSNDKDAAETEMIEVDEGARKRLKWDCESFASQSTTIYNRPTQIREPPGKLSKRLLRKLDQIAKKEEEESYSDCEMMDDAEDQSVISTVSTTRPKNETAEERRARKKIVKECQKQRRIEKNQNRAAFAEEARRVQLQKIGVMKVKPLQ